MRGRERRGGRRRERGGKGMGGQLRGGKRRRGQGRGKGRGGKERPYAPPLANSWLHHCLYERHCYVYIGIMSVSSASLCNVL